ncbi:ComEC/Rec2 family competence protein [Spiroplasma turonicum]|uniref:ComEC/Rec2 family competence protein n=1 Tax=Spiroplasma turonicum TaxID=216946 RepID=UPI00130D9DD4|nr:ComEC/Rec2 family competence protein [Spiroplasma turonicum]
MTNSGNFLIVDKGSNYIILKKYFVKYYLRVGELEFKVGEFIKLEGEIEKINKPDVYWGFNFNEYLLRNGINYEIKNYAYTKTNIYTIRYFIFNSLKTDNKLINLFLFQNKKTDNLYNNLLELGLSFLINLSGLNIFIIDAIIFKVLFKKTKFLKKTKPLFLVFLFFYNYIIGFKIFISKSLVSISLREYKNKKKICLEGWSFQSIQWTILLIIKPIYLFNIGFVYSIVFSFFFINKYGFNNKSIKSYIKNGLLITAIIMPLQAFYNYKIHILTIVFQTLLTPILSFSFIFSLFFPCFVNVSNFLYLLLNNISKIFLELNFTIIVGHIPLVLIFFYFITLKLTQISIIYSINKRFIIRISMLLISTIFLQFNQLNFFDSSIYMLNVGNGNSFLIKDKNKILIMDAGAGYGYSETIFKDFLLYKGIRKIDAVIISHNHNDHYNQLNSLKSQYKINYLYTNDNVPSTLNFKNINIFNFVELNHKDENDNSIVSLININNKKMLFMGDATKKIETKLLNNEFFLTLIGPGIDFLQVGHHGSKTSSSEVFINKVNPFTCYISGKKEKHKNFPNKETIETLTNNNCNIFVTDDKDNFKYNIKNSSTSKIKKTFI